LKRGSNSLNLDVGFYEVKNPIFTGHSKNYSAKLKDFNYPMILNRKYSIQM